MLTEAGLEKHEKAVSAVIKTKLKPPKNACYSVFLAVCFSCYAGGSITIFFTNLISSEVIAHAENSLLV